MRLFVFFDLPTLTSKNRRDYRKFRSFLIKNGFVQEQYSVYSRLALNRSQSESISRWIEDNSPPSGTVQLLIVTEKQYSSMQYIVGSPTEGIINNDNGLIIL